MINNRRILLLLILFVLGVTFFVVYIKSNQYLALHPQSDKVRNALNDSTTSVFYHDLIPEKSVTLRPAAEVKRAPNFDISKYLVDTAATKVSPADKIYTLKINYTETEVSKLARLLLGEYQQDDTNSDIISYSSLHGKLTFNKNTGAFNYQGIGFRLPFMITSDDLRQPLSDYLIKDMNIFDRFTKATAYYRREGSEGITYVEYHHDWDLIGAPILSMPAVPAMPETLSFQDLSLSTFADNDPKDNSIYFSSDKPGFARRTDFNSATIAYNQEGYLLSIESNLRYIVKEESLEEKGLSLMNIGALGGELNNQGGYFRIALPAGEGIINLDKVFPDNTLKANTASVTDVALGYLEKPDGVEQKYLIPSYIVRGFAETDTGYRVNFAQSIPAIEENKLFDLSLFSVYGQESVFLPTATPSPTPIILYCQDDSTECNYQVFKPTPTIQVPTSPTPTFSVLPTITAKLTPVKLTPQPSIIWPTVTLRPTQRSYPTPTPDNSPCILTDSTGHPLTNIQTITVFVPGLGTVYFFPGKRIAAAYRRQNRTGINTNQIYAFQELESKELQKRFADVMLADPNQIQFDRYGHLDLVAIALSAFNFDLRNTYNNRGLSSTQTPEYKAIQSNLEAAIAKKVADSSIVGEVVGTQDMLKKISAYQTGLTDVPFGALYQSLILTRQGGGSSLNASKLKLSPYDCQPVTTMSPSIYFYPETPIEINLVIAHDKITFADPFIADTYNLTATTNGNLDFVGMKRNRFYYEYKDVKFDRPNQGWIIISDRINDFIKNEISKKLGLSENETSDLIKDINANLAVNPISKPFLCVGLIDQTEITEKLPFTILPKPDSINRIHLFLKSVQDKKPTQKPELNRINRHGFSVIEVGVYMDQN